MDHQLEAASKKEKRMSSSEADASLETLVISPVVQNYVQRKDCLEYQNPKMRAHNFELTNSAMCLKKWIHWYVTLSQAKAQAKQVMGKRDQHDKSFKQVVE